MFSNIFGFGSVKKQPASNSPHTPVDNSGASVPLLEKRDDYGNAAGERRSTVKAKINAMRVQAKNLPSSVKTDDIEEEAQSPTPNSSSPSPVIRGRVAGTIRNNPLKLRRKSDAGNNNSATNNANVTKRKSTSRTLPAPAKMTLQQALVAQLASKVVQPGLGLHAHENRKKSATSGMNQDQYIQHKAEFDAEMALMTKGAFSTDDNTYKDQYGNSISENQLKDMYWEEIIRLTLEEQTGNIESSVLQHAAGNIHKKVNAVSKKPSQSREARRSAVESAKGYDILYSRAEQDGAGNKILVPQTFANIAARINQIEFKIQSAVQVELEATDASLSESAEETASTHSTNFESAVPMQEFADEDSFERRMQLLENGNNQGCIDDISLNDSLKELGQFIQRLKANTEEPFFGEAYIQEHQKYLNDFIVHVAQQELALNKTSLDKTPNYLHILKELGYWDYLIPLYFQQYAKLKANNQGRLLYEIISLATPLAKFYSQTSVSLTKAVEKFWNALSLSAEKLKDGSRIEVSTDIYLPIYCLAQAWAFDSKLDNIDTFEHDDQMTKEEVDALKPIVEKTKSLLARLYELFSIDPVFLDWHRIILKNGDIARALMAPGVAPSIIQSLVHDISYSKGLESGYLNPRNANNDMTVDKIMTTYAYYWQDLSYYDTPKYERQYLYVALVVDFFGRVLTQTTPSLSSSTDTKVPFSIIEQINAIFLAKKCWLEHIQRESKEMCSLSPDNPYVNGLLILGRGSKAQAGKILDKLFEKAGTSFDAMLAPNTNKIYGLITPKDISLKRKVILWLKENSQLLADYLARVEEVKQMEHADLILELNGKIKEQVLPNSTHALNKAFDFMHQDINQYIPKAQKSILSYIYKPSYEEIEKNLTVLQEKLKRHDLWKHYYNYILDNKDCSLGEWRNISSINDFYEDIIFTSLVDNYSTILFDDVKTSIVTHVMSQWLTRENKMSIVPEKCQKHIVFNDFFRGIVESNTDKNTFSWMLGHVFIDLELEKDLVLDKLLTLLIQHPCENLATKKAIVQKMATHWSLKEFLSNASKHPNLLEDFYTEIALSMRGNFSENSMVGALFAQSFNSNIDNQWQYAQDLVVALEEYPEISSDAKSGVMDYIEKIWKKMCQKNHIFSKNFELILCNEFNGKRDTLGIMSTETQTSEVIGGLTSLEIKAIANFSHFLKAQPSLTDNSLLISSQSAHDPDLVDLKAEDYVTRMKL